MIDGKIGIFDSGLGGISILRELVKLMPEEDYIYYGDTINNPYGDKSFDELCKITEEIVKFLISKNCKIIVIACNTATTMCRKYLEEKFPNMIFVGTVPAIKMASDANSKKTLVMATPKTITSKRTKELISDFKKSDQEIFLAPCVNLAAAIETFDSEKIDKTLLEGIKDYLDKDIDTIVLGCTHYPFIKKRIQKLFKNAMLLDGSKGVSREVQHQLQKNGLLTIKKTRGTIEIYNSKDEKLTEKYYQLLNNEEIL